MIQNLIGISGKMMSGKDTVGKMLIKKNPEFEVKAFAHKVKMVAALLLNVPVGRFYDPEFKKSFLPREWSRIITQNPEAGGNIIFEEQLTVRQMLQKIGTDALRRGLHSDTWINGLFADYKKEVTQKTSLPTGGPVMQRTLPNWVITDVRFPDEVESIYKRGGIVIRLTREVENDNMYHESETALDEYTDWTHIINNDDGDLKKLTKNTMEILKLYE